MTVTYIVVLQEWGLKRSGDMIEWVGFPFKSLCSDHISIDIFILPVMGLKCREFSVL
jgi:hypothetical protein